MPDPVSIILFQAAKWEMFLENLRRVLDLMEGKTLASNPITTVAPHAFLPVPGVVNQKDTMLLDMNLIVDCHCYISFNSAMTNRPKDTREPGFYLCTVLLTVVNLNKYRDSLSLNFSINN